MLWWHCALRKEGTIPDQEPRRLVPPDAVPNCPICDAPLVLQRAFQNLSVCGCFHCGTTLSVPVEALARFQRKRNAGGLSGDAGNPHSPNSDDLFVP